VTTASPRATSTKAHAGSMPRFPSPPSLHPTVRSRGPPCEMGALIRTLILRSTTSAGVPRRRNSNAFCITSSEQPWSLRKGRWVCARLNAHPNARLNAHLNGEVGVRRCVLDTSDLEWSSMDMSPTDVEVRHQESIEEVGGTMQAAAPLTCQIWRPPQLLGTPRWTSPTECWEVGCWHRNMAS
jgi:hypothetical protein